MKSTKEQCNDYSIKQYHWVGRTYSLEKCDPKLFQKSLVKWTHNIPCYPGKIRITSDNDRFLLERPTKVCTRYLF